MRILLNTITVVVMMMTYCADAKVCKARPVATTAVDSGATPSPIATGTGTLATDYAPTPSTTASAHDSGNTNSSDNTTSSMTPSGELSAVRQTTANGNRFVAYWSVYATKGQNAMPTEQDMKGVTHLILSFVDMTSTSYTSYLSSTGGSFPTVSAIKAAYPKVLILAAFGGWGNDNAFRPIAKTAESRAAFAKGAVAFVKAQGIDGLDIDWEYPGMHPQTFINPLLIIPSRTWREL